jgi:polygalacturonase
MIRSRFPGAFLMLSFFVFGEVGCAQSHGPLNVRTLGAVGDGKTKDTAAFQKALDQCAAKGGGEVVVPAGDYFIGSIALKSNTTLRLEKDANLMGTPDLDDYPIIKGRWEGRWVDAHRGLISAQDAKNIAVIGPGHIVGNPALGGRKMPRRPCIIEPINCTDIRFEDFSAQQQRMWTIHPTLCDNIVVKNLNIRSTGGNGDGIDVDSCRHVQIDSCDIDTGDDCIAIKSGRGMEGYKIARPSEDVQISNCTLGDSIFACIGVGSETSGGIRNIHIEHCKFTHAKTYAVYIKTNIDRGAFIEDISGNDLEIVSATGGFLRLNLVGSGIKDPQPVPGEEGIPSTKNFRFSNVKIAQCGRLIDAGMISPLKPLDGFAVSNVSGNCEKGIELANIRNASLSNINVTGFERAFLATANVTGTGLENTVPYKAPRSATTSSPSR